MGILQRCESRQGKRVRLLAVHTTEGNGTAQDLRDAAWWTGSSHAINDESGTLLTPAEGCVPYDLASWTLRSGNLISENIEQVGWARYTRAEWLARPKLLDGTARWLAARSKARGIPLVKLGPAAVAAGQSGVIGHVDWTLGMSDGSHTDPGPNYPWDVVLDKARQYAAGIPQEEDDMFSDDDRAALNYLKGIISWALDPTLAKGPAFTSAGELSERIRAIHAAVADPSVLAGALRKQLGDLAGGSQPVSQEMLEEALRKVLGSVDKV